jgi:hypothetical protein
MSRDIFRTVKLEKIVYPIQVDHGHLSADQRIDAEGKRIDILELSTYLEIPFLPLREKSLEGVWNYGSIYRELCLSPVPTIRGPLETILDKTTNMIWDTAVAEGVTPYALEVKADRRGLSIGYPELVRTRGVAYCPVNSENTRRVAIRDYPLNIIIDHSWCKGDEIVEHAYKHMEAVDVSFGIISRSDELGEDNLGGLFNYASLIHVLTTMQGYSVVGPIELLSDVLLGKLEQAALKQLKADTLISAFVEIKRTGYARCQPVLGVHRTY